MRARSRWWWLVLLGVAGPLAAQATTGAKLTAIAEDTGPAYKVTAKLDAAPEWPMTGVAEIVFDRTEDGASHALVFSVLRTSFVRREQGKETLLGRIERPLPEYLPAKIVLSRTPWRMTLTVNGTIWLSVCDDALGGKGVQRGATSESITFSDVAVQNTEPIWFTDDFMRTADQAGDWTVVSGQWRASGVSEEDAKSAKRPDPTKSANPFAYRCARPEGLALVKTGQWFWDTYRCETSVRATGDGLVAVCAYLQDKDNYLAFEWQDAGVGGERQLVAVRDGKRQVLATANGGWAEDQWYRIGIEVVESRVTALIDEEPVLAADSLLFGSGPVALAARGVTFADFDDVTVQSTDALCDDFKVNSLGRWKLVDGRWRLDQGARWRRSAKDTYTGPGDGLLFLDSYGGLAVTGSPDWYNYRVTAAAKAESGGVLGVVACYQDAGNYMLLRWGDNSATPPVRGSFQLVRVRKGREEILWKWDGQPFEPSIAHQIGLETQQGFVRAWCESMPVFETYQGDLAGGKIGVLAAGRNISFDQVKVDFLPPYEKVEFTEQFTKEDTMADWAKPSGSWLINQIAERGGVLWHRGRFYGDGDMTVATALFGGAPRTLRLIMAGNGQSPDKGYALVLVQPREGERKVVADLQIDGRSVRRAGGTEGVPLEDSQTIRFSRRGGFLLGYLDDKCIVTAYDNRQDREKSLGCYAGLAGTAQQIDLYKVEARSINSFDTTFVKAPWEWHMSKGLWETVNRWKCDPRWSFLGGYRDPNPLMWTKNDYAGEVQVEAYMAIKMDMPGPPYYLHPSDLGVAWGGDGRDILSGYAFVFAARNNTCSLLYKKGRLIKENTTPEAKFRYVGPQGEGLTKFHRHWFHLVVRRAEGRITCSVDGNQLFDEPDSDPVPSGKVGLFCVNNGCMVSRVKIWYEELAPRRAFPEVGSLRATADRGSTEVSPFANDFERGIGGFTQDDPRVPVLLTRTPSEVVSGRQALQITNLVTGGAFGVCAVDKPFQTLERPRLRFKYRVPPGTRVNLYLKARGKWFVLPLSGGDEPAEGQRLLGRVPGSVADGRWRQADVNLAASFARAVGEQDTTVERVVFGAMEPDPYLYAGFVDNRYGATWWLDDFLLGQ